jgi:hypothetical protein
MRVYRDPTNPQILHIRDGGACWEIVIGLPILGLGILASASICCKRLPWGGQLVDPVGMMMAGCLSLAFVLIGIGLVFQRSGIDFDREEGIVISW